LLTLITGVDWLPFNISHHVIYTWAVYPQEDSNLMIDAATHS
jgi:hypothetical protein